MAEAAIPFNGHLFSFRRRGLLGKRRPFPHHATTRHTITQIAAVRHKRANEFIGFFSIQHNNPHPISVAASIPLGAAALAGLPDQDANGLCLVR